MSFTNNPFLRRQLNKVQDFVSDPTTKRFAQAGSKILNVASQLGQAKLSGPWGIAGAAVGLLDVLSNHTKGGLWQTVHDEANKRGLRPINASGAASLLFEQGFFRDANVLASNDDRSFVSIPIGDDGGELAVMLDKNGGIAQYWDAYVSKTVSNESMANLLWGSLGNAITLTFQQDEYDQEVLSISTIDGFDDNEYIGANSPEAFLVKFRKFQAAGVRRAYLASGPPGSGKSTFCFKLAQLLGGRILVVTPSLLENQNVPHQDIVSLVGTFQPSVLVFEDVDRVSNDGLLLSLMDYVRRASPNTLVISTANNANEITAALKRPGRLGAKLSFPAPDLEWRKKIITLYTAKSGIDRDLTHLAEHMTHSKFTQDYIKEVCEQALVEDDDSLKEYIISTISDFGEDDTVVSTDKCKEVEVPSTGINFIGIGLPGLTTG